MLVVVVPADKNLLCRSRWRGEARKTLHSIPLISLQTFRVKVQNISFVLCRCADERVLSKVTFTSVNINNSDRLPAVFVLVVVSFEVVAPAVES